ncbi:histidine kinase [Neobacillus sp. SM06]|uniref:sensor histidine kinase n=1 Tax=Neobacillus sp. SM06 TaxID=3422492 RepID=UPI003D2D2754
MNRKERIMNKDLLLFLLKNGMIAMLVSFVIVLSIMSMLQVDIHYQNALPIFFFVLMIITVFFMIIYVQEKKIRSHQEQLLAVIKNSSQSILILDQEKNIVSINKTGRKFLGIESTDITNFCDICSTYRGVDKICDSSNCLLYNVQENPTEILLKSKNSCLIPVLATISNYTTLTGEKGIVVGLQKVSEKRKAEHEKIEKMITHSIFQAQEKERKLISRELHDGIGQSLFGILLQTDIVKSVLQNEKDMEKHLGMLQQMVKQTIEDVRNLSSELRPSTLDDHGLIATLKNFIRDFGKRFGIQINFTYIGENERLPAAIETALYRIAQEALINAAKYAGAERIDIVVNKLEHYVSLSITDFGKGFELNPSNRNGVGLYSMEERASILGGSFQIQSEIGKGTQIQVTIPILSR